MAAMHTSEVRATLFPVTEIKFCMVENHEWLTFAKLTFLQSSKMISWNLYMASWLIFLSSSMTITVLWDVVLCRLIETGSCFRGAYCFYDQGEHHPDNGGSKHL
jgi:hypothetical protein